MRNSHFRAGAYKITFIYVYISRGLKSYMKKIIIKRILLKVNVAVIYKEVARLNDSGGFLFLHPFKQK